MSLIILGKIGIAGAGIAVASLGGIALTKWLTPTAVEIYGFVETPITDATTTHPLKCKIDSGDKVDCQVKSVKKLTDDSKNHILLSAFKTIHTSESISNDTALDSAKFYKITIAESDLPPQESTIKSIEVFNGTGFTTSIGTVNSLLQIKNGEAKTLETWKTKYFVGQASSALKDSTDISGYKCSWTQGTTDLKECTIKPFVDKDDATNQKEDAKITDLTFTKDSVFTENKKITEHNYYLIEFKDDSDAKEKASFTESEMVYLKEGNEEKVTFKKLSAVQVVGDQLLILKQQTDA